MSKPLKAEVAVIGAGPGGYGAAFMAADLGLDVALIDVEENPGGTCLYRGCIPSKALLHAAKTIIDAREAAEWGLHFGAPRIDLDTLRERTQSVVAQLTGGLGGLTSARKIQYVQGRATYVDANTLAIFKSDASEVLLHCENSIIAAGSRPATFGKPIDSPRVMNSTHALELSDVPKSLLVIGGGYIGLELGTVYAALGAKVTIVEFMDGLLPGVDRDLVTPVAVRLERLVHAIHLNTKVVGMKEQKNGMKVTLEGPHVNKPIQIFDKVLMAVGRKPNASGLGLKSTKVQVDKQGFIQIDAQCRTADPSIFAVGDVVGGAMLAHKATHEGRIAAEVIAGRNAAFEPMAIPAVVFTDPEIAWCGLTESEAKAAGRAVEVSRFPWAASGRAATLNRSDGVTKLLCDPETKQVLGVGIAGAGAGELIAEGVLAIEMGALAADLAMTIHPHPTLSESIMEAAAGLYGHSTHVFRPGKKRSEQDGA